MKNILPCVKKEKRYKDELHKEIVKTTRRERERERENENIKENRISGLKVDFFYKENRTRKKTNESLEVKLRWSKNKITKKGIP